MFGTEGFAKQPLLVNQCDARPPHRSFVTSNMAQRPTAEIKVPSEDPKKKKEEEEKKPAEKKAGTSKPNGDKKEEEEELVR